MVSPCVRCTTPSMLLVPMLGLAAVIAMAGELVDFGTAYALDAVTSG